MKKLEKYVKEQVKNFEAFAWACDYEPQTTFYADLSVAEWYGVDNVREKYNHICRESLDNVEDFAEFVMCLMVKGMSFLGRDADVIGRVYNELYHQADKLANETYTGDEWLCYHRIVH